MLERVLTNLLLDIIAGILLFGREATMGGFRALAILGIVLGIIFLVLWGVAWFILNIVEIYRSTETSWKARMVALLANLVAFLMGSLIFGVGVLWSLGSLAD